ncbi:MAG TPA: S41 family peptidase [Gemmataceae bacterium]|nr:S41 family peptidase [Gemmataceae bacterium]
MTKFKITLIVFLVIVAGLLGPEFFLHQGLVAKEAPAIDKEAVALPSSVREPEAVVALMWQIMELVSRDSLEPCSRPEMILAGIKSLAKETKVQPPADLERRVADVANQKQLTALVLEVWPRDDKNIASREKDLAVTLLRGVLQKVPGKPPLLPPEYLRISEQLSGNRYVGIGIQITMHKGENYTQIVVPFRRGTARKAGAKPGDLIVEVDGKNTHKVEVKKVVDWLRGAEGTTVTVVVRQPGAKETRTLRMKREITPFDTVLGYRHQAEDDWSYRVEASVPVAYVRVESIRASTLHELRQVERRLQTDGIRALVLDFRGSQGEGILHHGTLVADGLLDHGLMWQVRDLHGKVTEYRADRECLFRGWPLAVLTDGSEIDRVQAAVIAALQDNGRAIVVGEPVKCDGYVSTLFPLGQAQGAIMLRTARLERPGKGQEWNIQPDHLVTLDEKQRKAVHAWLTQKDLPELPPGTDDRPPEDAQLAKSVELLKAALAKPSSSSRR